MKPVAAIRFCLMNALVAIIILNNEFKIRRKSAVCVLISQVLIKYSSIMYAESFPIFFLFQRKMTRKMKRQNLSWYVNLT